MDLLPNTTSSEQAAANHSVAVLPIGAFEQHGDHLPLTTDTIIACVIAKALADAYDLFCLPPLTISCSHEHEGFAGTVSITANTLTTVIDDIRTSLTRGGITGLVLVNAHGGNYVLSNITQQANIDRPHVILYPGRDDWKTARADAQMATSNHDDMHAGELETSILLHTHPDLVGDTYTTADHDAPNRPHLLVTGMSRYTPSGVIGRPSQATPTKGKHALDSLTASFADHLKILTTI